MNIWSVLCIFVLIVLSPFAQAASFNCAKAQTKVEHTICDDLEISRLDEELVRSYKTALQDQTSADEIKREQKQWLKERNQCSDISCLRERYSKRVAELSETEHYTLKMSKDDELCNHMLQLFNDDLKKYGWNGDAHQEEHEEFKRVPWQPARFSSVIDGRTEYTDVEGALFDFNNDGALDYVVRWKSSLSNARADLLFMFDTEVFKRTGVLDSKDLWSAKDQIYLAGNGYLYSQKKHLSEMDAYHGAFDPRVLEPFIYRDTSYLVMRNLFEHKYIRSGYAVISKYGGGQFVEGNVTGEIEDICYFKRADTRRAH